MEKTTAMIDLAREDYIPVANRGQILFFCLSGMANVDPMYQYSLEWFTKLFVRSMAETEPNGNYLLVVSWSSVYLAQNYTHIQSRFCTSTQL